MYRCALLLLVLAGWFFCAASAPARRSDNPAIFIYFRPGMVAKPDFGEFDVAVWNDGRIVWRDPPAVWARRNGTWGLQKGTYYEAHLSPEAVQSALGNLAKMGVFGAELTYVVPDAASTAIRLRVKTAALRLESCGEPADKAPYGRDPKEWARGVKAWRAIRRQAKALIPAVGKKIRRPDDQDWDR